MSPPATIKALCSINLGILRQKLHLIELLKIRFGNDQAKNFYKQSCPIVKASIGQHIRHSMDHLELAARIGLSNQPGELHYDLRQRGENDEHDMDAAVIRLQNVVDILQHVETSQDHELIPLRPVQACFMLSANPMEYKLPSTIGRELGFAAHHAIHHMAMVRIIATGSLGLLEEDLPSDFGRAPSTVVYDKSLND